MIQSFLKWVCFCILWFIKICAAEELQGRITSMELIKLDAASVSVVQLNPLVLPLDLPEMDRSFEITLQTSEQEIYVLSGQTAIQPKEGKIILAVPLKFGQNQHRMTVVDPYGKTTEYEIRIAVENTKKEEKQIADVKAVLVAGPLIYYQSISRTGSGISTLPVSGLNVGARGIYRYRLLKSITDRIQKNSKIFADLSGAIAKSVSGDAGVQGLPRWLDGRFSFELLQGTGLRFELGIGMSYFGAGLSNPVAGDIQHYLGFALSGRAGYQFKTKFPLSMLVGINYGFPSTEVTDDAIFTSRPLEAFIGAAIPRGANGAWELRLRFFQLNTEGLFKKAGSQTRNQTYFGPEIFWIKRF